jgi:hypothetical protein
MSWLSRLLHGLAVYVRSSERRKRDDADLRDKTVAFIHAGIVATLIIWGYIAVVTFLAESGDILISYKDVWLILLTAVLGIAALGSWSQARDTARRQLRAYLTVIIGNGSYQDENLKFDARPVLTNNGQTPAHKVSYAARAAILPYPLDANTVLDSPAEITKSAAVLGPTQTFVLAAVVPERVPDEQVVPIMAGYPNRVYIWGRVTYEDVFGRPHFTEFCQSIYFQTAKGEDGAKDKISILGNYAPIHNEAD